MSTTHDTTHDTVRAAVRTHYAALADGGSCCGGGQQKSSLTIGYDGADLAAVPSGADLGLGCGNPQAIAALRPGETVLDLGCGAGFDVFLAARAVGRSRSRDRRRHDARDADEGARQRGAPAAIANVEFRLGEIEHLPVADASVDVVISNCVVNLSPEQQRVLDEAFRVLRPGGRLAISDVVTSAELPEEARADLDLVSACVSGASTIDGGHRDARAGGLHRRPRRPGRPDA